MSVGHGQHTFPRPKSSWWDLVGISIKLAELRASLTPEGFACSHAASCQTMVHGKGESSGKKHSLLHSLN